MTSAARWLLAAGVLLFAGMLVSQGLQTVAATLALAGWGLLLVALFHLLPLALDAAAIRVLFTGHGSLRDALLSRWVGETANSLLIAGQLGGPVLMARHLALRGMRMRDAAAVITVSTTLQASAQVGFALLGVGLLAAYASQIPENVLRAATLMASGLLALQLGAFYFFQRRGLFGKLIRVASRLFGKSDWSRRVGQAEAVDAAVQLIYGRGSALAASFALSSIGWLVGTGEVYITLQLIRSPVSWGDALLLESLGQAIRGAAFAIPGALGVQEAGFLLLAPFAGLHSEAGLALSLAKRTRELLLGLPGLLYVYLSETAGARVS